MVKLYYDLSDLNRPIAEIFTTHPSKWNELLNLKSLLGAYLANLERLFLGVFGQPLQLEGTKEQYILFKKTFPIIGDAMEKSFGFDGFKNFCAQIAAIRNVCMHAYCKIGPLCKRFDAEFISHIPNANPEECRYNLGEELTLAGLLSILLCMGNKEMVSQLMASGICPLIERIPLWTDYSNYHAKDFSATLEAELGNDFEVEIRQSKGTDVLSAIWGEYAYRLKGDENGFRYFSTQDEDFTDYRVKGFLTKNGDTVTLHISKGSYYQTYFADSFVLEIVDIPYFIECANSVPPFLFISYLCRRGIKRFDRDCLSDDDKALFQKLNKAKFYVDKSIHVILLGKKVSDQRPAHQTAMPQVLFAILNLESNILRNHRSEIGQPSQVYYSLKELLVLSKINRETIEDVLFLRNFFAHGSIIGDYSGLSDDVYRKLELSDVLEIFRKLVLELKENESIASLHLCQDIANRLSEQLYDMKYKALAKVWHGVLNGKEIDWDAYGKTMKRIGSSAINNEIEDALAWFVEESSITRYDIVETIPPRIKLRSNGQIPIHAKLVIVSFKKALDLSQYFGNESTRFKETSRRTNKLINYRKMIYAKK